MASRFLVWATARGSEMMSWVDDHMDKLRNNVSSWVCGAWMMLMANRHDCVWDSGWLVWSFSCGRYRSKCYTSWLPNGRAVRSPPGLCWELIRRVRTTGHGTFPLTPASWPLLVFIFFQLPRLASKTKELSILQALPISLLSHTSVLKELLKATFSVSFQLTHDSLSSPPQPTVLQVTSNLLSSVVPQPEFSTVFGDAVQSSFSKHFLPLTLVALFPRVSSSFTGFSVVTNEYQDLLGNLTFFHISLRLRRSSQY